MKNIYDLTRPELEEWLTENGENKAKAKMIFRAVYSERNTDFSSLACSERVKNKLCESFSFDMPLLDDLQETSDAAKLLLRLYDGNTAETAVMKHDYGIGVCVSTQVGCNMGCAFCESGRLKKVRDLTAGEMVGQLLAAEKALGVAAANVVLMGIGEPLDNFTNTSRFLKILTDPYGLAVGNRHITVSTCGIVPKIADYFALNERGNFAVSLHAPDDEIRSRIMPINRVFGTEALISEVKKLSELTKSRITFEYIMLGGVNDSRECAEKLVRLLSGIDCYVNLIPYNETESLDFKRSPKENIAEFFDILRGAGMWVTVRHEFGTEIDAACGQLRNKRSKE